ncbi:hypothetical protein CK203_019137 [Vitis vinifera]|uniref:Reverse transcriptase domain-containing protein n=1 Tax=Vitis vinifera TaxID=29760 RepID=A0A438J7P0_VITVI|nr:hypothetical protein CK203_019137 [Vitis vinifera]
MVSGGDLVFGLLLKSLSIENSVKLEEGFTKNEVFETLMDLNKDKAPDLMVSPWFSSKIVGSWGGVEDLKDFKPISLVGSLYKILAKVLANRVQGDCNRGTLSPYLFVLIMEALSSLLRRAMEDGFILSFRVGGGGREGVLSSNLLFVDDTLLFFNPCLDQLTYLAWVLLWFKASSGLKIILSKCELIPIGDVPNVEELASVMGCGIGKLLATYLGLPLCTSFKAKDVWDLVEESKFGRFREEEDKMVWKASKNEVFSVRSFYNALEDNGEVTFPSKII